MDKNELVARIEVAKASLNRFDLLESWLEVLTEYVLEQPKEPVVRARLPREG